MNLENKGEASKSFQIYSGQVFPNLGVHGLKVLIDRYGIEFVKGKNRYYSPKLKQYW